MKHKEKNIFCTIDLGDGRVGDVFGWFPVMEFIDSKTKEKTRTVSKQADYITFDNREAVYIGLDSITFEDGISYKILEQYKY